MTKARYFAICLVVMATGAFAQQQPPTPPPAPPFGIPITMEQAQTAIEGALAEAKKINVNMAIAVVEPTGELVYFRKMNGAPYSAIALSQGKAVSAARYRRPTKFFYDMVQGGQQFFTTFPQIVASPGRVLIVVDGKLIGATAPVEVTENRTPKCQPLEPRPL